MPPIVAAEYKSAVGLRDLYYALVTQDDANGYVVGTPKVLAPAVTASLAPTVNTKTQYADDQAYDVMTSEGETKIDLEVTELPTITLAEITGAVYTPTNHRMFDNGGVPPFVALGFRSKKSNGSYRYYWFLKGRFSKPGEERATDSDTPDPKVAKLTFTAIKTVYQFTMNTTVDGVKRVMGDTDDAGFSSTGWFTSVQTPSYGAVPAFTLTPVPADNATGIGVSATITLTFTNQLVTGTNGIVLMKQSDRSLPNWTYAIDSTLKIVTITAGTALSAASIYYISLADVTDIYGQKLTDVVLKFTTA
jgi:phi13 family phage major tail protein